MPQIQVTYKQKVTETWNADADVPQEVIDEGEEAIEEWLYHNQDGLDNHSLDFAEIDETLIDVQQA